MISEYKIKPETKIRLDEWSPESQAKDRKDGKAQEELSEQLQNLQEILFAEHRHKILVVLQGMDTSGKDGTIKHVFQNVNPAHVRVASFKQPTQEELDHDFLWRVHRQVPGRGEMVIFNRSHYEDVLIARVHNLVSPFVWRLRYRQINDFERLLAETGTTVLKFFLHISKDEQKKRLEKRRSDKKKQWKFNPQDLKERKFWADYQKAYEDALSRTSTAQAPWYIIPANQKWYRNLVISKVLVETLKGLRMRLPSLPADKDPT